MDIKDVIISKNAMKDLKTIPLYIVTKLQAWIDLIEHEGLLLTRKIPGFHDEPLKGTRQGQRSIRLSKAYRAIYCVTDSGDIEVIEILEVNKHNY